MKTKQEIHQEIGQAFGQVPHWMARMPDAALEHFWGAMRDFYFGETKLPMKTKELIGVAVSGATRCRYCALFHTEGARLAGATEEEIAEAAAMAGFSMDGSTFLNAMQTDYDQFAKEIREIMAYVKQHQAAQQGKPQAPDARRARPH